MKRRSLAAWAVLAAVPVGILTSAAVSSASPVAPAAHSQAVTQAQLTAANAFADGSGTPRGAYCTYPIYDKYGNFAMNVTVWVTDAPPCVVGG